MEYFICEGCGRSFAGNSEFLIRTIQDKETGWQGSESICPACHSDEIFDAKKCVSCGTVHKEDDLTSEGICPVCEAKLQNALNSFLEAYSPEEQEYMIDYWCKRSD